MTSEPMAAREWNRAVLAATPHAQFLQSYEWGLFQRSLGRDVIFLENAVLLRFPLWSGASYLYCPRGPLIDSARVIQGIRELRKDIFFRFEPTDVGSLLTQQCVRVKSVQPDVDWYIDTHDGEEALLSRMHPKARYNIRLASKKSVQVQRLEFQEKLSKEEVDTFWNHLRQTARTKEFRLHPREYYRALLSFFLRRETRQDNREAPYGMLYTAEHKKTPYASAFVMFFGNTATYLHGGTALANREFMAPYLLHWEILRDVARRGYRYYTMGGITLSSDPSHPWSGITRFKKGFGGESISYPGTHDLPLQKGPYMLYTAGRKVLRMLRALYP